jgi:fibronectin type 3 domain-containing protein
VLIGITCVVALVFTAGDAASEIYRKRGFSGCTSPDEGTPGFDEAVAECNAITGQIGAYATAFVGAAGATAMQYWYLPINPPGVPTQVNIEIKMIIAHGCVGFGAPQFSGTYKVYAVGQESNQTKIELDAWLDTEIAISKIIGIISFGFPVEPSTYILLMDMIRTMLEAGPVEDAWVNAEDAGDAEELTMNFNYTVGATQDNIQVWGGVRAQAAALGLGSATATAAGIVRSVRVTGIDRPLPVAIAGPDSVLPNTLVDFQLSTPGNNEDVRYWIDWDDGQAATETYYFPGDTTITVSHVFNDERSYNIQVKAYESDGLQSTYSSHNVLVWDGEPNRVRNVAATDGDYCDKVVVTWDPEGLADGYTVWTASPGAQVSDTLITTYFEHTTLPPGEQREYYVVAHNSHGYSYSVHDDFGHRKFPPEPAFSVDADADLCAVEVGWGGYPDGVGGNNEIDFYEIYRSDVDDFGTAVVIDTLLEDGSGNHSWYDMPDHANIFYYWIVAWNECGAAAPSVSDWANWAGTAVPGPSNLYATWDNCNFVYVTWSGGTESHRVLRDGEYVDSTFYGDYYRDYDAVPGTWYNYEVEVWNTSCGGGVPGDRDGPVPGGRFPYASPPDTVYASDGQHCSYVRVQWPPVPHTWYYKIYRDTDSAMDEGDFLVQVDSAATYYDDTTAPANGDTRYYRVKAFTRCDDTCDFSEFDTGHRSPASVSAPTGLAIVDSAQCDVLIVSWNPVGNALYYSLYRDDSPFQQLTGTTYYDESTAPDFLHQYKVTSHTQCMESGSSGTEPGMGLKDPPPKPTNVQATDATICGQIEITWDAVPDAFAYRVSREGVVLADSLEALSFLDTAVPLNREMQYAVKAINVCGVGPYAQDGGRVKKIAVAPGSVNASDGGDEEVTVAWSGGVATMGYTLMRDGEDIVTTTETSYVDRFALPGMWYEYSVRSHTGCGESAPSAADTGYVDPDAPTPRFVVEQLDLFQDTFPIMGMAWGVGRADVARDILPDSNFFSIRPGDSVSVTVIDGFGLDEDPVAFGAAVYCWVRVNSGAGAPGPGGKTGDVLTDDPLRWPVVDSLDVGGRVWYQVRMDTVFTGPGRTGAVPDRYCVDLSDDLFESGDTVLFFFHARSMMPDESYWSEFTGHTRDVEEVAAWPMEFQVLPGGAVARGGEILYVDDSGDSEALASFRSAFQLLAIDQLVDRYDVRDPSACASNSPGGGMYGGVVGLDQLAPYYTTIIWNTGDETQCLLGDGSGTPAKADDFLVLYDFLYTHPEGGGVYISGNNLAQEWNGLTGGSGSAMALRELVPYNLTTASHQGVGAAPAALVLGEPGTLFDNFDGPDSLYAYSAHGEGIGFDVLEPDSTSYTVMSYQTVGGPGPYGAVIANVGQGWAAQPTAMILSGFSYHRIRDIWPGAGPVPERVYHLADILEWFGHPMSEPVPVEPPTVVYSNRLAQNRPNPFNPTTTIEFSLRSPAQVTLSVYNVRGQLVRVLLDERRAAGLHKDVVWEGRNDAGQSVASGIYFYRLVAGDFTDTRKMVLLK